MTRRLPLFPLGTVLVPGEVLPLHVFEPRYRALMDDLTGAELGTPLIEPEFGVVLIERGHEVGGGDVRAEVGTVARLLDAERLADGRWVVATVGAGRFRVLAPLPDDPYPQAEVEDLDEPPWDPADDAALAGAAASLSRLVELAGELHPGAELAPVELPEDPVAAAWHCLALAPLGPFDRHRLLSAADVATRLALLRAMTDEVADVLALRRGGG